MRIGLSVLTHAGQNIWENGLGQNVIFLSRLFKQLSFVRDVVLLDSGDQGVMPDDVVLGDLRLRVMKPRDATEHVDVVIEMAGGLDVEWLDYMRARGVKVVFLACGQPYAALIEPILFSKGGYAARADRCDMVWILPKDRRFTGMLEAIHRCPVVEVPYLWSSEFIDRRIATLEQHGLQFGFNTSEGATDSVPLNVAIFEPNISVVKNCAIPMLVCDEAYRGNPSAIASMRVLNSIHMADHPTFNYLANSLEIVKAGRALFEGRHDFPAYMAQHANAVVSHQWHNDQNYLYMDALYGGYPLIHNSEWLGGRVGYYYPHFKASAGALQLLHAACHHRENLPTYQRDAREFLVELAPDAEDNKRAYTLLLLALHDARRGGSC
ncbi:DUF2827 domain-containing protein [Burkholderia sp. Ac-20345]|uniref:DUF2827 domain-containing protein n=1 Tax=Burkholderia sp. Ac-20345 TaxID=2703891 RepID=UPI00197B96CA|nr:DUF2827 domain-containing protein [Burkholderia sp. Ac-20345]MBN3778613.1 DUF2827 domain-containing protein [Burkholderia sp. Ac-20345]